MKQNDIVQILADDDEITPSPGFQAAVMQAVEREAVTARSLKFPWLHALPGILATVAALLVAAWDGIVVLHDPAAIAALNGQLRHLTDVAVGLGFQWLFFAIVITIVSVLLPLRSITKRQLGNLNTFFGKEFPGSGKA